MEKQPFSKMNFKSLEELQSIKNNLCKTIVDDLYKFKDQLQYDSEYNLDSIELIEENLDELFYKFQTIKQQISYARLVRYCIENKNRLSSN